MAGGVKEPHARQNAFRFRIDGRILGENTAVWGAAENVNFFPGLDSPFRLRFAVDNTGTAGLPNLTAYYSHEGGTWTRISTSSSVVRAVDASAHGTTATLSLIHAALTPGAGSWSNGQYTESGTTGTAVNAGDFKEMEYALQIVSADVSPDDEIEIRVESNTSADAPFQAYNQVPVITIPAAPTTGASPTTYSFSNASSDLTGETVNKSLVTSGAASGSWSGQGLGSQGGGGTSIVDGSFFTGAGVPGADGANIDTNKIEVSIDITSGNANLRYAARATRVNSSGAVQAYGPLSAESASGATAVYGFDCYTAGLGAWASGDRLRIDIRIRNNSSSAVQQATFTFNSGDSWVKVQDTAETGPQLTGAAASSSEASASLSVKRGIATAIAAASLFTGTADIGRGLSGAAASSSAFAASLTVEAGGEQVDLDGALASSSSLSGDLARLRPFDGAAASSSAFTADIDIASTVALDGALASESAAEADASIARGLDGSAASSSALAAEVEIAGTVALAGSAEAVSHFAGAIGVTRALAGAAEASSTFAGELDIAGTVFLAGAIDAASSLAGELDAGRRLSGAVASTSEASADVNRQPGLAGDLASESDAEASVAVARALDGSVAAVSAFAGDFEVSSTLALSGSASSLSEFAAGLTVGRGLAGTVAAVSEASADLVAARGLTGALATESDIAAALDARRSLTATATAESAWTAGLSTVAPRRAISYALRPREEPSRRADQEERRRHPRTVRRRGNLATGRR